MGKWKDRTRGGFEYRIWVEDAKCSRSYPIKGEIRDGPGEWFGRSWTTDGQEFNSVQQLGKYDLIPIPAERWVRGDQLEVGMVVDDRLRGRVVDKDDLCESGTVVWITKNGRRYREINGGLLVMCDPNCEYLVKEPQ